MALKVSVSFIVTLYIRITGPIRSTICFQFITINSLYMFPALICSSSGGTVYTAIHRYHIILKHNKAGQQNIKFVNVQ
jgi:hypothetical protein